MDQLHLGVELGAWVILIGLLGWLGRAYVKILADHMKEDNLQHIAEQVFKTAAELRIDNLKLEVVELKEDTSWIVDSLLRMAAKLGVSLPER